MEGLEDVRLWLIDGFNVLHAGVLRGRDRAEWWKEERRSALLELVARFRPGREDAEVWIAFDGERPAAERETHEGEVGIVFAPSADDWLAARVREATPLGPVAVVTADRRLAERVRRRGARVVPPRSFLERCS